MLPFDASRKTKDLNCAIRFAVKITAVLFIYNMYSILFNNSIVKLFISPCCFCTIMCPRFLSVINKSNSLVF